MLCKLIINNQLKFTLCQFYSGCLPLEYAADLRTLNFYAGLIAGSYSPANILFKWFGVEEHAALMKKYAINVFDSQYMFKIKVHKLFEEYANTLL
jgi:hypothetical protein